MHPSSPIHSHLTHDVHCCCSCFLLTLDASRYVIFNREGVILRRMPSMSQDISEKYAKVSRTICFCSQPCCYFSPLSHMKKLKRLVFDFTFKQFHTKYLSLSMNLRLELGTLQEILIQRMS
jgi:hypothetical protein